MKLVAANDNQPKRYGPWLPTKEMALERGAKTYFSGSTCVRGHIASRATSSRNCTACLYEDGVRRRTSPETADGVREYMKNYQRDRKARDPDFVEMMRAAGRKSDARPERKAARNERKKWRLANDNDFYEKVRSVSNESNKKWKKANPDAVLSSQRTRRARLRGAEGTHTAEEVEAIHKKQKYKCAECGVSTKKKKHVDHIMPLALGGSNWASNLQILCPFCNDSKGAKHPIEFAQRKGRLF